MDEDARDDDASDDAVADDAWMTLQYPSDDFPAPSPFRLRVPTGWGAMVSADADLAVAQRDVVGRFRPNVIVKVHRLPRPAGAQPDIDLDVLLTEDERLPGVEIVDDERREGGEAPARRRLMHYVGPENVRLRARRLLVYVPVAGHAADVVSAVGTTPDDADFDVVATVDAVVDSLKVGRTD